MITKGIIKSIDLLGNTCTVHLPFFETAGNDPIIETATVSNTPGSYNGYKVGDVVYVAFEDGNMDTPVVIGKLYLGTEKEKADPRGVSNVEESTATKKATLPADAKLTAEIDSNVPNTTVPYSSLSSIANGLNTLNTNVGQMDRDYGNRFKQVISNADGLKSELEQTAENMVAKVSGCELDAEGNPIPQEQFGWSLQKDSWTVFTNIGNENKTILTADKKGLHVAGQVEAESGHIGNFMIGDSGISSSTGDGAEETAWISNYTDTPKTDTGVYVGPDGIKLGKNFSVDTKGKLYTKSLTIAEDAEITGTIDSTNINVAGLNADGIKVVKKDENGNPVTIDGKEVIVFNADAKNAVVEIGGFTVTDNNLSAESGTSAVVLSTDAILLGGTTTSTAPFSVTNTGELTATKGKIGGFTITDTKLFAGENSTFVSLGSNNTKPNYIAFTGEQVIGLGSDEANPLMVNYSNNTLEITVQLTDSTTNQVIFGHWESGRTAALCVLTDNENIMWRFSNDMDTYSYIDTGISKGDRGQHTYKMQQGALYVDDKQKGTMENATGDLNYLPLWVGGSSFTVDYPFLCLYGNVYSFKLTQGKKEEEWTPAIQNGKYGLFLKGSQDQFRTPVLGTLSGDNAAIYSGSKDLGTAPFSVTDIGELRATRGKVGGWKLTDTKFIKNYIGTNSSYEVAELSPTGISFKNTGGSFTDTSVATNNKNKNKINHYLGIDTQNGLGLYGDKITRVFQTTGNTDWQNIFTANVPGIIKNPTDSNNSDSNNTNNITLLIYDTVTIDENNAETTWSPADTLAGNIDSIVGVFVSWASPPYGRSIYATIIDPGNAVKITVSEVNGHNAHVRLLALCEVSPSARS